MGECGCRRGLLEDGYLQVKNTVERFYMALGFSRFCQRIVYCNV